MRDAVAAEKNGVPSVVVLTDGLCSIASETARVLGREGLPIITVETSLFGLNREAIAQAVEPLGSQIAEALTRGDP